MSASPKSCIPHIKKHEDQLLIMAKKWDWQTCRLCSETVFVMICDSSLPEGWKDRDAVRDIQREIIEMGKRSNFNRDAVMSKTEA